MNNIDFLLIDDDLNQEKLFIEAIEEISESKESNITYKVVKTPEEAMTELYQNCFRAIIIDLKLKMRMIQLTLMKKSQAIFC